ncbi:MAG: hypothetical protein IJW16_04295 [Clostridia bacterium]|nr:hypothetical protein [Clostridia bacterium]
MTRREFLRRYFLKFIAALTLVGLIVYTLYHALGSAAGSLLTTPARRVSDTQILGGEAVLFRSEALLEAPSDGLINDLVESGSKVARDVAVAQVWQNMTDMSTAEAQRLLYRCNRIISVLEAGRVEAGEPLSGAQECKDRITADYLAIKQAAQSGNLSALVAMEDDMLSNLCRYATMTGTDQSVEQVLEAMKVSKNALLLGGTSVSIVNTEASGYYYNRAYVDGGESIFTEDALESLTAESFDALCAQFAAMKDTGNAVGKMVRRHEWSIAVDFSSAVSSLLVPGLTYRVTFPENSDLVLTLTCVRIVSGADGREIVILQSSDNPRDFEYLRRQRVEIEVGSCNGYYIPEQALHTGVSESGETVDGVYIFENSTVYFRRIEILYRGDGYVIAAEQGDRGSAYLALNDIIVISGGNLYDGRVLK